MHIISNDPEKCAICGRHGCNPVKHFILPPGQ